MPTFSGEFLGCKISRQDLDVLRERHAGEGLADVAAHADVHVVNGCCVTAEAVAKTRASVRRALGTSGTVVVTGCAARLPTAPSRGPRSRRAGALLVGALPHLHVPLQSGSDRILAAMGRRYGAARYLERIAQARSALGDDLHVTAEVLVGFPGETEDDFEATLDVVRGARLGGVHAFPYSPRPGTRTADADSVAPAIKRARSARLRELAAAQGLCRRRSRLGAVDEVLVERTTESGAEGYGRDYTWWRLDAPAPRGAIVRATATATVADGLAGRAVAHSLA